MPYIKQAKRDVLDPYIEELLNALRELESDDPENNFEGNINYVFTVILDRVYSGTGYTGVKDAVGTTVCAILEFYRRVAAPYENQKAFENGDVYRNMLGVTLIATEPKEGEEVVTKTDLGIDSETGLPRTSQWPFEPK